MTFMGKPEVLLHMARLSCSFTHLGERIFLFVKDEANKRVCV